jgi:hypothetical protein
MLPLRFPGRSQWLSFKLLNTFGQLTDMCNSSVRLFHVSIFMFCIHHITGTFKNVYSSNISGFSSCIHYCNNYDCPFSSTVLDPTLNFQTSRMTINIRIYNWYMSLTAAFSSESYVIPFWNCCLIWKFAHCLMLEVFHKTVSILCFSLVHTWNSNRPAVISRCADLKKSFIFDV